MSELFSLDGLDQAPFYLKPEQYDFMLYPAEWVGNVGLATNLVEELSDVFYRRTYGRHNVYYFWTLFVRQAFSHWFEDDIPMGYRNMITNALPEEFPNIYHSDAFSLLQSAKLKELRTDVTSFRQFIDDYVAIPLIPAALAVLSVEQLNLQEGKDPTAITSMLSEFKNFLS